MNKDEIKKIEITVQREDRLRAITELCEAINTVAKALNQIPTVNIQHCNFDGGDGPCITLGLEDNVSETKITQISGMHSRTEK